MKLRHVRGVVRFFELKNRISQGTRPPIKYDFVDATQSHEVNLQTIRAGKRVEKKWYGKSQTNKGQNESDYRGDKRPQKIFPRLLD